MEKIRAYDKRSYQALHESILLNLRKLDVSLKGLKEKAKSFEIQGKNAGAIHCMILQEDPAWLKFVNLLLNFPKSLVKNKNIC